MTVTAGIAAVFLTAGAAYAEPSSAKPACSEQLLAYFSALNTLTDFDTDAFILAEPGVVAAKDKEKQAAQVHDDKWAKLNAAEPGTPEREKAFQEWKDSLSPANQAVKDREAAEKKAAQEAASKRDGLEKARDKTSSEVQKCLES
ncbi:hypothetical protein ABZ942_41140 [Nocardia sp. NPDC046473]|uniref:hypothetical protein n=1 Tax=Nocardia sp. NPDC046473 TaxID=3155733 RepID=UPI0033C5986F